MNAYAIALLPERSLVEIKGPDSTQFLQGLITNDIERAKDGAGLFAGLLSPQGKILFDFFLAPSPSGDGFLIDVLASHAAALVKRLGLYKLRASVAIADRSAELAVAALWGAEEPPRLDIADGVLFVDPRLAGLGWRLLAPRDPLVALTRRQDLRPASAADYDAHRLTLLAPEGGKDYAFGDAYPHEACYDQLQGVDFKKGCYVGQEIVARMEFRRTARTRLAAVETASGRGLPAQGSELRAGDAILGRLGSAAGSRGLALIRVDRAEEALAKGLTITAGAEPVLLKRPPWARYPFADAASA